MEPRFGLHELLSFIDKDIRSASLAVLRRGGTVVARYLARSGCVAPWRHMECPRTPGSEFFVHEVVDNWKPIPFWLAPTTTPPLVFVTWASSRPGDELYMGGKEDGVVPGQTKLPDDVDGSAMRTSWSSWFQRCVGILPEHPPQWSSAHTGCSEDAILCAVRKRLLEGTEL